MGKKGGGSSWLTAVKRAFRSPSKETDKTSSSGKRREEHDHEDDEEEKKREKRRWLFRKPATNQETVVTPPKSAAIRIDHMVVSSGDEQRHAIAVAVASAAAADAAVASAHAAVEVTRLTRPLPPPPTSYYHPRDHYAAIVIQTAFRGYLGRRALRALKGLVKLQALVRGHNVRKQAKMTLRCMQALVRVQARVLDQRMRLSHDGSSRKSTFSDTASILESRYLQDISDRRTMSRDGSSSVADDWDERPHTIEEVKAMLQHRKESALKREKTLSQAFSHQMWRNGRGSSIGNEEEIQDKQQWLDGWTTTKPWDGNGSRARASTDQIKTVEIDTSQPYSYLPPNFRRSTTNQQYQRPNSHTSIASPLHRAPSPHHHQSPITPSPSKARPVQVRSASPRCIREDRSYNSSSQTPSLRSSYFYTGNVNQQGRSNAALPNYMAATESAKARVRSQSAPRQRPSTPERDRAGSVVKKRLSYPVPDPYGMDRLRSPSFKSISGSHFGGLEQQSNYSSCCTDSLAGAEISPSSTSDYRRWLR